MIWCQYDPKKFGSFCWTKNDKTNIYIYFFLHTWGVTPYHPIPMYFLPYFSWCFLADSRHTLTNSCTPEMFTFCNRELKGLARWVSEPFRSLSAILGLPRIEFPRPMGFCSSEFIIFVPWYFLGSLSPVQHNHLGFGLVSFRNLGGSGRRHMTIFFPLVLTSHELLLNSACLFVFAMIRMQHL